MIKNSLLQPGVSQGGILRKFNKHARYKNPVVHILKLLKLACVFWKMISNRMQNSNHEIKSQKHST